MRHIATVLAALALPSCSPPVPPVLGAGAARLVSDPCIDGADSTALVQAAMDAGTCLPPGSYNIDMPALGVGGRRRDVALTGGTLCGMRDDTLVRFRGDAHMMFWAGVAEADVHNITLDSACVRNTHEQTHLIRLTTGGHAIRDVKLVHPPRPPNLAGDTINIVGIVGTPMAGPVIDHVDFASCARFGVQITRGMTGGRVSNSTFDGTCAIGSEGDGSISGLTLDHLEFRALAGRRGPALSIQRMTDLAIDHVTSHGRPFLLYMCERVTVQHSRVDGLVGTDPNADWASALSISTSAHDITVTDSHLTQARGTASVPVVSIGPVRSNYQVDIGRILITNSDLIQGTPSPVVSAQGVDGLTLSNNSITLSLPSIPILSGPSVATAPAVSVPATNIVQYGNAIANP